MLDPAGIAPRERDAGIYIPTIETERLILRGWREEDLDAYASLVADEEVTRYTGGPVTRPDAWRGIAGMLGHWALRGYGLWAVERKSDGIFIGRVGLLNPEGWPGLEVAWMLARGFWGYGYATEAARAALDFGFQTTPASSLISSIDPANRASQKVAERLREMKTSQTSIKVLGKSFAVDVWEIDRARWSDIHAKTNIAPP